MRTSIKCAVRFRTLKVGSRKCSTLVAALSGNEAAVERAVAIDWWSGGEDFLATPRVACRRTAWRSLSTRPFEKAVDFG
eukprot:18132-Prymnesium_polylepis.1